MISDKKCILGSEHSLRVCVCVCGGGGGGEGGGTVQIIFNLGPIDRIILCTVSNAKRA